MLHMRRARTTPSYLELSRSLAHQLQMAQRRHTRHSERLVGAAELGVLAAEMIWTNCAASKIMLLINNALY